MLATDFKRTKLVVTLGPATDSYQSIKELVAAGANCLRLNMSHGDHTEHSRRIAWGRKVQTELKKPVSILVDLQGPKIRMGDLPAEGVILTPGKTIQLALGANYGTTGILPVQYDIAGKVKHGEAIALADGRFRLQVKSVRGRVITATVVTGGILTSRKGINLPDTDFGEDTFTVKDSADLAFGIDQQADYIGLSFVQRPGDVTNLKRRLYKAGSAAAVITKVETKLAVEHLEEIVKVSDAVMVARGDLSQEIASEQVPAIQQRMVEYGQIYQKPVIIATQMLLSMMHAPQPTCAEVSDVATAVMQKADAVMLSDETTIGDYPIATVATMKRIIVATQAVTRASNIIPSRESRPGDISQAAITLAQITGAKAIIAETSSGQTARSLASFRPPVPIIAITHNQATYQQMALLWGCKSFYADSPKEAAAKVIAQLKKAGNIKRGEAVVIASGQRPGVSGETDTVRVEVVK